MARDNAEVAKQQTLRSWIERGGTPALGATMAAVQWSSILSGCKHKYIYHG